MKYKQKCENIYTCSELMKYKQKCENIYTCSELMKYKQNYAWDWHINPEQIHICFTKANCEQIFICDDSINCEQIFMLLKKKMNKFIFGNKFIFVLRKLIMRNINSLRALNGQQREHFRITFTNWWVKILENFCRCKYLILNTKFKSKKEYQLPKRTSFSFCSAALLVEVLIFQKIAWKRFLVKGF